jgi:proline dehydrogenase
VNLVWFAYPVLTSFLFGFAAGGVSFGQLLGMCDHVSFHLGAAGYRSYKYVPYGPVREVMPYLMRRAQENGDMLGRVGHERTLLFKALRSRLSF